jgi:hypothetical protein
MYKSTATNKCLCPVMRIISSRLIGSVIKIEYDSMDKNYLSGQVIKIECK